MGMEERSPASGIGEARAVIGFGYPLWLQLADDPDTLKALSQQANDILQDPVKLQALGDRVYRQLQDDLRIQRERHGGYGRHF